MKDTTIFLIGTVAGAALAAVAYAMNSVSVSPYAVAAVSGVTLIGFGLALGGYILRWRGDKSKELYFMMGVGIGIVVVAFLSAGAGVSPYIPS